MYLIMLILSSIYAGLLATKEGQQFAKERTAETVMLGTGLVLLVARLAGMPWRWWRLVASLFAVAGLPMYLRSMWLRVKAQNNYSMPCG